MITLISIFYLFILPINEPAKTACQGKLEALNYVYEYNFILMEFEPDLRFPNKTANAISENISMINCFKQALSEDKLNTKILLISINFPEENIQEWSDFEDTIYRTMRRKTQLRYDLPLEKVYYKVVSNTSKNSKIELIDKNDAKLQGEHIFPKKKVKNVTIRCGCKDCPF